MNTETSTYEVAANEFLISTGSKLDICFEKFDYHFPFDKHKRNIFKVILSNKKHKYCFRFGASLKDSLQNTEDLIYEDYIDFYSGLKYEGLKKEYLSYSDKIRIADIKNAPTFKDLQNLIKRDKAKEIYDSFVKENSTKYSKINIISFPEWMEMIVRRLSKHVTDLSNKNWGIEKQAATISIPSAYDILACIEKYPVYDFEDFCSNYGHDSDSRSAYKTYKAVKREWENISKLFTASELEALREIQ